MKHKGMNQWQDPVLRLDGLPESCTMADVQIFFQGKFSKVKKKKYWY